MNSEFAERDLPSHEGRAGVLGLAPIQNWSPHHEGRLQVVETVVKPKDDFLRSNSETKISKIRMTGSVRDQLDSELGTRRPEQGGILLGPADEELLATHFIFDRSGRRTSVSYTPDAAFLNRTIRRFKSCQMACIGICHSHPSATRRLSTGDLEWARVSFANPRNRSNSRIFMPIFCDGELFPYLVTRSEVLDAEIQIV